MPGPVAARDRVPLPASGALRRRYHLALKPARQTKRTRRVRLRPTLRCDAGAHVRCVPCNELSWIPGSFVSLSSGISVAIVVEQAGCRRALDTRNRPQVFIDGPDLPFLHAPIGRPRHDLEQIAV